MNEKNYLVKKEEINSFLNYIEINYHNYDFIFNKKDIVIKTINDDIKYKEYIFRFYDNKCISIFYKQFYYKNIHYITYTNILRKEKILKLLFQSIEGGN